MFQKVINQVRVAPIGFYQRAISRDLRVKSPTPDPKIPPLIIPTP